jgi:hypothetical protein
MASVIVPRMHSWGHLHCSSVLGALGLSPCHGGGLRAPFLFGHVVAFLEDYTRPRVWTSLFFPGQIPHDIPLLLRFLMRPRLLTRMSTQRELALRRACYPAWVKSGKLDAGDSKYQVRVMEEIVRTLMRIDAEGQQLSLFGECTRPLA